MGRKSKKKGIQMPMSQPPITIPELSAAHTEIAHERGLIYEATQKGFTFINSFYTSGRYIDWSDVKALSAIDGGIALIYNNDVEETIPSTYANWSVLVRNLPDSFGWFEYLLDQVDEEELTFNYTSVSEKVIPPKPIPQSESSDSMKAYTNAIDDLNLEQKRAMLDEDKEEKPEPIISPNSPEVIVEPSVTTVAYSRPTQPESQSDEDLLRKILQESSGEVFSDTTSISNASTDSQLLSKILSEATTNTYRSSAGNRQVEQTQDIRCPQNGEIIKASALGFTWKEVGGNIHNIDFGKYNDAYFDDHSNLVFEHRYGPTLFVPHQIQGWKVLLGRLPFKYRSISRNQLQQLLRSK